MDTETLAWYNAQKASWAKSLNGTVRERNAATKAIAKIDAIIARVGVR